MLDADPSAETNRSFQVVSVRPLQEGSGANTVQRFVARVANLTTLEHDTIIAGEVLDGAGLTVATVEPYAPGTEFAESFFSFSPGQELDLVVPWDTAQFPPGSYRVQLRVIEPGTITRELPTGIVLASGGTRTSVTTTRAVAGELAFDPPLIQANADQSTALSALVVNAGNVPLEAVRLTVTITDPEDGQVLHSAQATVESIAAGDNILVDFGAWIPSRAGDLAATVRPDDAGIVGEVRGTLFVGDKATGTFTVDRHVVPLGTQTVRGSIELRGVDVRTAAATDPLFFAVREALRKGGEFVAPNATQWSRQNRCLGCHIQTQSLIGLQGASGKAPVDHAALQFLFNQIVGSQQNDGGLRNSHPQFSPTSTALGLWSLADWPDVPRVFRSQYRAAVHLLAFMRTSGDQSWWDVNHCSGWWCTVEAMNMMSAKGLASVLRNKQVLAEQDVDDYVLTDEQPIGVRDLMDFEQGPDGRMYFLDLPGVLHARDLDSGVSEIVAAALPAPSYGLALDEDGTAFVSSQSTLMRIDPDGSRTTLLSGSGFGLLTDVVIGPDGLLYVADNTRNIVWQMSMTGQVVALASGGSINRPFGLAFDGEGGLLVASRQGSNILRIDPDGAVSVFVDGLPYRPLWIKRGPDGDFYVLSERKVDNGQDTPVGLYRIKPGGYVERPLSFRAPNSLGINALGVVGGAIYVGNATNRSISRVGFPVLETNRLGDLGQALTGVARFTLARHRDNSGSNIVQALRLITLGEAREHLQDAALRAQTDEAVAFIATLLRQRQRADGGWGAGVSNGSDSLATALVGLALEYTNPSVNDPAVRNAITFLLARQSADKSWPNENRIFSTRLASTSFVMAYLPLALERLGGIDIDLNVVTPSSTQLSNPTIAPAAVQVRDDGSTAFRWHLQGVTGKARSVEFDLTLRDLAHREERQVAADAFLEFANSFNGSTLRSDLVIPRVKALSELSLQLSTDRTSYPADSPVAITGLIANLGPPQGPGQVHLYVRAAGEVSPLADLGAVPFGVIDTQASLSLPAEWNTGRFLAGDYEIRGELFDETGRLADEATAAFVIVHDGPAVDATIAPDKPVYQAWDKVVLTSRVRNPARNAVQPAGIAELTVRAPDGVAVHFATYDVDQLPPGGLREFPDDFSLVDAPGGEYRAELVVKDGRTRSTVTNAATSFQVERDALQALAGKVEVQSPRVFQGDPESCTDIVDNLSHERLDSVRLTKSLVSLDREEVESAGDESKDFIGGERHLAIRKVDTASLPVGGYACLLSATVEGRTKSLGAAGFEVLAPPIRLEARLDLGDRGRLLVLLDPADSPGAPGPRDPHRPTDAPDLATQRAFLEALLDVAGWSFTIVTDSEAFARELRSGGHSVYALFSEQVKLAEQVQKELREAVYRGEGLLDAGEHDQRHHAFDEALGIRWLGRHPHADGLELSGSELHEGGFSSLDTRNSHLKAEAAGASVIGRFTSAGVPDTAVTAHAFGHGRSVYAGFDLLAEAARADQASPDESSLFAELLLRSLDFVHPPPGPAVAGQVVSIRLTVSNLGIAIAGRALLPLPESVRLVDPGLAEVNEGVLIWPFELEEGERRVFPSWVRLPPETGEIALGALVQTSLEGGYLDQADAGLVLRPEIRPDLEQARLAAASDRAFKQVAQWLEQAAAALDGEDFARALFALVQASDAVAQVEHPGAAELRLAVAQALWKAGRGLSGQGPATSSGHGDF